MPGGGFKEERFDVVIVGAGIAGALIAKKLVAARKRVLILEAGQGFHLEGNAAYLDYQKYLQRFYANAIKVPNSPYPPNANAPSQDAIQAGSPYWRDPASGYFVQKGALPFSSDYLRAQGGTTLHWNGTALRMLPNDFKLQSLYGQGVDWPISYDDLRPYYEKAEFEIGVSGSVSEQKLPNMGKHFYSADYVYPMQKMPQSYMDQVLGRSMQSLQVEDSGAHYDVGIISTPMGRNSIPAAKGYKPVGSLWDSTVGVRCEGNSNCVPICPVQAKYNALKTLAAAVRDHPERLTIQPKSVASNIDIDPDSGRVTGITYKQYKDPSSPEHTVHKARGKIYVIAAHSVETAKLLLASGAARTSGQVGRNLMDHSCMMVWGLMPKPVGAFRGPASTSNIPTFRDGAFRSKHAAFIAPVNNWGWQWPTLAPGSTLVGMLNPPPPNGARKSWIPAEPLIGRKLRHKLGETISRQVAFDFEIEQPPQAKNFVTIDPAYKDQLGNYRPVVTWDIPDYTKAAMPVALKIWNAIRAKIGIPDEDNGTNYRPSNPTYVKVDGAGFTFGGAGHLVGTHCMGTTRFNSVVDSRQRTWDHDNLYLAGCGNMATLGTSNPTLTMAALACWAAENILEDLRKR